MKTSTPMIMPFTLGRSVIWQSMAFAGIILAMLPVTPFAAPVKTHSAKPSHKAVMAAPVMYECQTCHMKVTAAQAKKDHFKDAMDGGTLVPVKAAKKI